MTGDSPVIVRPILTTRLSVNIKDLPLELSIFIGNKKGVSGLRSSFDVYICTLSKRAKLM